MPSTPRSQRASVAGQARTMAVALPRQTMASAARGAPIQLPYKQKIPREPRTRATPNNATRDRRSAKLMLSILRQPRRSTPVPKRAAGPRRHWLTTYSASARCCRDSGKLGLFPHTADFWSTERSPHLSLGRITQHRPFDFFDCFSKTGTSRAPWPS